jgi:Xaa-Pro dipeptidase
MSLISPEEYGQRAAQIQVDMAVENLDALLIYSWKRGQVRYISGYHPNYIANVAMVILPCQGPPALRIRFPFDLERAQRESWIEDVAASGNLLNLAADSAAVLRQRNLSSGRIGLVSGDHMMDEMPHSLYVALQRELPRAALVEAGHLFREVRQRKSPAEFELLRASARLANAGAEAARQALAPGCSEFEVIAAAEAAVRKRGAEEYLAVIASKGVSELIGPPEDKPIEAGDNVIFELAVQKGGYWTQVARVFYVGGPTPDQRAIYQATFSAYEAAVAAARLGNRCADVAAAARLELERAGYGDYIEQDFGHGIGLDLPEPPRIEAEDETPIEPGMVLVIHPAVRVPEVGGAFIGGTVLIRADGPEPIHNISAFP